MFRRPTRENVSEEFFAAIQDDREDVVNRLLHDHPSLVDINRYGAIHWCAAHQREKMFQLLIHLGAELNSYQFKGCTPLQLVIQRFQPLEKKLLFMTKLLDAGAEVDYGTKRRESPLSLCNEVQVAQLLIDYGANLNYVNPLTDLSVLMMQCTAKNIEIVRLLLGHPRLNTLDYLDKGDNNALGIAVAMESEEMVTLLIQAGADTNGRTIDELFGSMRERRSAGNGTTPPPAPRLPVLPELPSAPPAEAITSLHQPSSITVSRVVPTNTTPSTVPATIPAVIPLARDVMPSLFVENDEGSLPMAEVIIVQQHHPLLTGDESIQTAITPSAPETRQEGPTHEQWELVLQRLEVMELRIAQQQSEIDQLKQQLHPFLPNIIERHNNEDTKEQ